jgi:glyoxylase-like metal-dependent hydrolase (beta-lactamase superfamily II)
MSQRALLGCLCILFLGLLGWFASDRTPKAPPVPPSGWKVVHRAPALTVHRSDTIPAAYLLEAGGRGLLLGCPEGLAETPVPVDRVLLHHAHRDAVGGVQKFLDAKVPVFAPPESMEYLERDKVTKFWKESIPLRNSRTGYFVHPVGFVGVGELPHTRIGGNAGRGLIGYAPISWGGVEIRCLEAPGISRDHMAYRVNDLLFVGDALTGSGHIPRPYTTDWDHWTDVGLKPTGETLRKLAYVPFAKAFPARGAVITDAKTIRDCAAKAEEAAFHKSFERFSDRLGNSPDYDFLVNKEQIASGGDKPWSKISPSLWLTGNTYVLKSNVSGGCLVLDPWGQKSVVQVEKLRAAEKLGPVELVIFSHAHYDHFDGVYTLPEKGKYKVWALDRVAEPLIDPFRFRAPFLDERPIAFDKTFRDGESGAWQEYSFKFGHLPGQTDFTASLQTTIDGKRCVFTADNFFHRKQFSGTGGWMGLNRSTPANYGQSAQKILDMNPEWILAEHGGPYVFNAEDYRRRVLWGASAAKACDAICVSGDHRKDWSPHTVDVEPVLMKAKPGESLGTTLRIAPKLGPIRVTFHGRGIVPDQTWDFNEPQGTSHTITIVLPDDLPAGRHVFAISPTNAQGEFADPSFAVEVVGK